MSMYIPDEKLEPLRQTLQERSKDPITTEDARNLIRYIELLIEADKKSGIIKDKFQSSG